MGEVETTQTETVPNIGKWYTPLTRATPLAKYLALVLFVVLPFVGFWLGVGYGTQVGWQGNNGSGKDMQEYAMPIDGAISPGIDTRAQEPQMNLAESWMYANERLGFAIQVPNLIESSFVFEEVEKNTVTFRTVDSEDTNGPEDAFVIVAVPLSEFYAGSFLEEIDNYYWVRDIAYPSGPTAAKYVGESDAYAFYFMKGNDCYPGNNCDVYTMSDSIVDTFTVTRATRGTVRHPSNQAKVWREYYEGRSSSAFWYPTEWGDVRVEDVSFRPEEVKNDPTGEFNGIDLSRVQTEGYSFSFSNAQCDSLDFCVIGFQVRYFSNEQPIELDCQEQQCKTLNLVDDRESVKKNYSFENKGNRWLCVEGYSTSGGNVFKKCRAYNGNIKFELQMGYRVKDFESLREIYSNNIPVTLDDAVGKVNDDADYSALRTKYEEFLKSTLLNP